MGNSFALIFLILGWLTLSNAGICWRRKNSDGKCSGFRGFYSSQKSCCEADSCSKLTCEEGMACRLSADGLPLCYCQTDCSTYKHGPVCGSDGRTYKSECYMRKRSCGQHRLDVEYRGTCKKNCVGVTCLERQVCVADRSGNSYCINTHCPSACPSTVSRVCGTDGKTYLNKCALKKASCVGGRKIDFAYLGTCEVKNSCRDVQCPKKTKCMLDVNLQPRCDFCDCTESERGLPVCGSDGKKYKSWCHMRKHSCSIGKIIRVDPRLKCQ
ncbi:follistatin-like isoform X2 [Rhopilema esculentum]|uniref:follistatin-like isoform X2 n=1 Tax=Rhopilema esculentum TaxID=499914 RepID=UPI0031E0BA30